MLDAPRQDWSVFKALTGGVDSKWNQSLTTADRIAIYFDLFNIVWNTRTQSAGRERLEQWRWKHKLADRQRMLAAFTQLDQCRRERAAENNAN